jgi:hypothetical protein
MNFVMTPLLNEGEITEEKDLDNGKQQSLQT